MNLKAQMNLKVMNMGKKESLRVFAKIKEPIEDSPLKNSEKVREQ